MPIVRQTIDSIQQVIIMRSDKFTKRALRHSITEIFISLEITCMNTNQNDT